MSSTYRRICLSHTPALVIDEDWKPPFKTEAQLDEPPKPPGHPACVIGVGRWSGGLIEVWLPTRYYDHDGDHAGRWYDVSWMSRCPDVVQMVVGDA